MSESVITNLRAFARLYGYVRFFHPSDEASAIDWDRFAILGSRAAKQARSPAELRTVLENLFRPIAPTIQLYGANETPCPFPHPGLGISPLRHQDTKNPEPRPGLKTVHWNHHGVGRHHGWTSYFSRRTARRSSDDATSRLAFQHISSNRIAGKEVKVSAYARTDSPDRSDLPGLWLGAHTTEIWWQKEFRNLVAVPITSLNWQQYSDTIRLSEDCTALDIGCHGGGAGTVWADEFELAVQDENGEWKPEDIKDPGFEIGDSLDDSPHWNAFTTGARSDFTTQGPFRGKQCLMIETDPNAFFNAVHLKPGESVDKEIAPGLFCRLPLALHSDDEHTLPRADAEQFTRLKAELDAIDVAALTPRDQDLRLGDVVIAWNVLQHFYPYFDVVDTNWDLVLTEFLTEARAENDAAGFLRLLKRMAVALHDGHAAVTDPNAGPQASLPGQVEWVENRVVVTIARKNLPIRTGDVILAVDGKPAEALLAEGEALVSGTPQWKRARTLWTFLHGPKESEARLTVLREGSTLEVTAKRDFVGGFYAGDGDTIREIESGIWLVDLSRAPMKEIDAVLDRLASAKGVIFDVRCFPNNHGVLQHLIDEPVLSARWNRPEIVYPDQERIFGWSTSGRWTIEPKAPRIRGKVVFLISGRPISYGESVLAIVEHYRLGELVGQTTPGTNGNVNLVRLPGGYRFLFTGMKVLKHDGSQHHLIGIRPTVPLERTLKAVLEGRDEYIEKALELIESER
jgi:C-terminal processing protease CtpA/Prc